jgi:Flp pilus assembly protein TadD
MFLNTLGVAQYRVGNWADAIASFTKANELSPDRADFFNGFFLAMSHWQLGQKDEAREWYDRAVVWMEKNQPKNNDLLRFRAEADELVGSSNDASQSSPPAAASPQD